LFLEGSKGQKLYIMMSGKAQVLQNKKEILIMQDPFCCFGETAM